MPRRVVIVGAGQAGFQAAITLRENGFDGAICLIGRERHLPYQRPPLSKAFLARKFDDVALPFRPESFYISREIVLRTGVSVERIDRDRRHAVLSSGEAVGYDHLVLATGARNRHLPTPGAEATNVFALRDLDDAVRLRDAAERARQIVVVGAGFIGLEFAAFASGLGCHVLVLDAADRAMARTASPPVSAYFTRRQAEWGAEMVFGVQDLRLSLEAGAVSTVRYAGSPARPCDMVVVGIGVEPDTRLAKSAGLAIENGVAVDALFTTDDPAISSIGDCAAFPMGAAGHRVRIESVQAAVLQARIVAAKLTGSVILRFGVPWFWSDQGDAKLQIAGLPSGADRHIHTGTGDQFSVLGFAGPDLLYVESVNQPLVHLAARKVLANPASLSLEQAIAPSFNLRAHAAGVRAGAPPDIAEASREDA